MLELFFTHLKKEDNKYRQQAVLGLSKIDSPLSRSALRKIAFRRGDSLQVAAIGALAKLHDTSSLQQLKKMMEDDDLPDMLKTAAGNAYDRISSH